MSNVLSPRIPILKENWVEEFGCTGQPITLGLLDTAPWKPMPRDMIFKIWTL